MFSFPTSDINEPNSKMTMVVMKLQILNDILSNDRIVCTNRLYIRAKLHVSNKIYHSKSYKCLISSRDSFQSLDNNNFV